MQTLGLSPSTPKPESRLKNLLWPTIQNEVDVDYVGRQGFWICLVVGLVTFAMTSLTGAVLVGLFEAVFFLLGGIGVRQRSRFASVAVFSAYTLMTLVGMAVAHQGPGILGIVFLALLLANVRGTWLSARWRLEVAEPPPVPMTETFTDKLTDLLPIYVWPVARWIFYALTVFQIGLMMLVLVGLAIRS